MVGDDEIVRGCLGRLGKTTASRTQSFFKNCQLVPKYLKVKVGDWRKWLTKMPPNLLIEMQLPFLDRSVSPKPMRDTRELDSC
jgi:hypothetical protein